MAATFVVQVFLGGWSLPSRLDGRLSRRLAESIALRHAVWTRAVKMQPVSTKGDSEMCRYRYHPRSQRRTDRRSSCWRLVNLGERKRRTISPERPIS